MSETQPTIVFAATSADIRRSFSPGVAVPVGLAAVAALAWFGVAPVPWLIGTAAVIVVGWLAAPVSFWVFGRAPRIEIAGDEIRIVRRRRKRSAPLSHLERAELTRGGWDGHVVTRTQAWPEVAFVWRPEVAPGVEGFPKELAFGATLPVLGRRRLVVLRQVAATLAAAGLPCVISDVEPAETFDPALR